MLLLKFTAALLCVVGGTDAWSLKGSANAVAARDAGAVQARTYETSCGDSHKVDACKKKVSIPLPSIICGMLFIYMQSTR